MIIKRVKQDQIITLITVCDNNLVMMLAALLTSIEQNHTSSEKIDLYIVDDAINEKNKKKLNAVVGKMNVIWKKLSDVFPNHLKIPLDKTTFPANVYARLCIPYFIDPDVDKAIYLDVDMIVLEDISKLWHTDIGNFNLAAVTDRSEVVSSPWGGIKNYSELGLNPNSKYLNAGMLVLKPKMWRKLNLTEKAFRVRIENINVMTWGDQYCINVVFNENWFVLDRRWNSFAQENIENPYLIHFTGIKPIFKSYTGNKRYKEIFFDYLNKTEWTGFKQKSTLFRLSLAGKKLLKKIMMIFRIKSL